MSGQQFDTPITVKNLRDFLEQFDENTIVKISYEGCRPTDVWGIFPETCEEVVDSAGGLETKKYPCVVIVADS